MVCPRCGARFGVREEEQVVGFRTIDELRCPKCGGVLMRSAEVEFFIEEEEDE